MPAPVIRHVGTTNGTSTYKVVDAKVDGGEATVVVFKWEADGTWGAKCHACDDAKCAHAVRAMTRAREGR